MQLLDLRKELRDRLGVLELEDLFAERNNVLEHCMFGPRCLELDET